MDTIPQLQTEHFVNIPDPRYWLGVYPRRWTEIAQSQCPVCRQKIGYNVLSQLGADGWEHVHCPPEAPQSP